MKDNVREAIAEYGEHFKKRLPTEMLLYEKWQDVADIVKECIEKDKTAEELGYAAKVKEDEYI